MLTYISEIEIGLTCDPQQEDLMKMTRPLMIKYKDKKTTVF